MKLLIFCSSWMYEVRSPTWTVYANVQEPDPRFSSLPKFSKDYVRVIEDIKPDFVLAINVGCSEAAFDRMNKPKGPKYITWSTDSYRHTSRAATSDLHLTSIPDASMKPTDNYVPLFFEYHGSPLSQRQHKFGIHCRVYPQQDHYRQKEIQRVKSVLGDALFVNQTELHPFNYIKEIKQYRYGLNIGVYDDALPNFRSFEYGACGVMPVCRRSQSLESLLDGHVLLYDDIIQLKTMSAQYDPIELQRYYNTKHCLGARLTYIFKKFFGLEFVPEPIA